MNEWSDMWNTCVTVCFSVIPSQAVDLVLAGGQSLVVLAQTVIRMNHIPDEGLRTKTLKNKFFLVLCHACLFKSD